MRAAVCEYARVISHCLLDLSVDVPLPLMRQHEVSAIGVCSHDREPWWRKLRNTEACCRSRQRDSYVTHSQYARQRRAERHRA